MAIQNHPGQGVVVFCDYSQGFVEPEMVKRRPAIVLCPPMQDRWGLCNVVALSTTPPDPVMPYNKLVKLPFMLPPPFNSEEHWIKGDMINSVGWHRLDLVRLGKDRAGKRRYLMTPVGNDILTIARRCALHGLGLSSLTKHL